VDLNEVCQTAARLLQYDALTRHAVIALSLDPRLPTVTGDPIQFQQVVLNLILNALEAAAASDAPRVEISTAVRGDDVEVAVRDNGPVWPRTCAASLRVVLHYQSAGLGPRFGDRAFDHRATQRAGPGRERRARGALFSFVVPRTPILGGGVRGAVDANRTETPGADVGRALRAGTGESL
jgi:hypothetical protein